MSHEIYLILGNQQNIGNGLHQSSQSTSHEGKRIDILESQNVWSMPIHYSRHRNSKFQLSHRLLSFFSFAEQRWLLTRTGSTLPVTVDCPNCWALGFNPILVGFSLSGGGHTLLLCYYYFFFFFVCPAFFFFTFPACFRLFPADFFFLICEEKICKGEEKRCHFERDGDQGLLERMIR